MKNIIISTENTSDLTKAFLEERGIATVCMHYFLNDREFSGEEEFDGVEFYNAMRAGAATKTSLINEFAAEEYFAKLLNAKKDIVHIGFASACSGSVQNLQKVAAKLNEKNQNKIYVVDSLAESGGQGLLVTLADDFANTGKTAQEVYEYAEKTKHRICHYFCVESIKYLARGGRVSKVAAFIGGIINIKPVLHTDTEGKLVALNKEITRKKSLTKLVEYMKLKYDGDSKIVYICSADCDDDANFVANLVKEEFGMQPRLFPLGPVIGSHSGPGTVALFFTAKNRLK